MQLDCVGLCLATIHLDLGKLVAAFSNMKHCDLKRRIANFIPMGIRHLSFSVAEELVVGKLLCRKDSYIYKILLITFYVAQIQITTF
jgi:hypothetical protein